MGSLHAKAKGNELMKVIAYSLLGIATLSLILLVVAAGFPETSADTFNTIGAKRLILGTVALVVLILALGVYVITITPSNRRLITLVLFGIGPPLVSAILLAAGKPEYIRVNPVENNYPGIDIKFGGFDGNSVWMLVFTLLFIYALVYTYTHTE